MDFTKCALLALMVFTLLEVLNHTGLPIPGWAKPLIGVAAGIAVVAWGAHTVWAHEQVVNGKALDTLDGASQAFAGTILGALAVGINVALNHAIPSIGQNQ
jgi:hypothetical protein